MAEDSRRITLLPEELRARVSSSCVLVTPENVVEGLLRNALDAAARLITIEADFARGWIAIGDDGAGIKEIEFTEQGQLAKVNCSSKQNASPPTYGHHGRFLSSLSSICLLSIASASRSEASSSRLVFHRGAVVNRRLGLSKEEAGLTRQGTKIIVHKLFGDVPVRFKQLSLRYSAASETDRAFALLKEMVVGYLLAYSAEVEVRLLLHGDKQYNFRCSSSKLVGHQFGMESVVSTLVQAKFLSAQDTSLWRSASVRTSHFCIRAAISTKPSPSRAVQFISVGQFPLRRDQGASFLFDTIERLFEASSFGAKVDNHDAANKLKQHRNSDSSAIGASTSGKGVDRFSVFYLRIDHKSDQIFRALEQDEPSADVLPIIEHLTAAVESLIAHFLTSYGFAQATRTKQLENARDVERGKHRSQDAPTLRPASSELARTATQARHLSYYWNRVKSALPLEEDFRIGLGFDASANHCALLPETPEEPAVVENGNCPNLDSPAAEEEHFSNGIDSADNATSIAWTNPRNGRVVHLNPRTGSVMMTPSQEESTFPTRSRDTNRKQHTGERLAWPSALTSREQHPARARPVDLHKYLGRTFSQRPEPAIPLTTFAKSTMPSSKQMARSEFNSTGFSDVVTRSALATAQVVKQVDQKFVLATVAVSRNVDANVQKPFAILIDQHAADERIKYEQLCRDFCLQASVMPLKPLIFELDETEAQLFQARKACFQEWGLDYEIIEDQTWRVEVTTLPSLIAERCRAEPKLLIELMRRHIWSDRTRVPRSTSFPVGRDQQSWYSKMARCPEGMVDMLKSRSCRTAIMFNDALDIAECHELVRQLSRCVLPFQCAHGRPTSTVLTALDDHDDFGISLDPSAGTGTDSVGYGSSWRDWIRDG